MSDDKDPVHAFVLSGGGAFGAYEVGVMKALFEDGTVDPAVYSGTSVGAFSAALMCQGGDGRTAVHALERVWLTDVAYSRSRGGNGVYRVRFNPFELANVRAWQEQPARPFVDLVSDLSFVVQLGSRKAAQFVFSTASLGERAMNLFDLSALISVEPFHRLVKRVDVDAIRRSRKQIRLVATRWDRSDEPANAAKVFRNADMTVEAGREIILASAAIPTFFPPVRLNADYYVDGGVAANTPLLPAIEAGGTIVHLVDLEAYAGRITNQDLDSTMAAAVRTANIAISAGIRRELEQVKRMNRSVNEGRTDGAHVTAHRYHPRTPLGGPLQMLDFGRAFVEELIDRGYQDWKAHDCAKSGCIL